ncbi:hypothetical protein ACIQXA_24065 [Streptomyces massasporeus]|uniref:hypothetical protein n=1 Tax=Streptomyces massasporeus TaxID=67324 RepID=UPI00382139CC
MDVAFDTGGHCYVSDDRLGAVLRVDEEGPVVLAGGLGAPQGLASTARPCSPWTSSTAGCGRCP